MPFAKLVKNKAYFKRFQTKFRRRREGKTDYYARRKMITQAKNKYNAKKYRMVVRITNKDVCCQVVYSRIEGDYVVESAYSHELPAYGIKAGFTNYAACYATGLLLARRVNKKFGIAELYEGVEEADGEMFYVEESEDGPRPFECCLDIGLTRATTGNRVFACLKGAVDGGISIPHNEKRLVGYDPEEKEMDAEVLRDHIFGKHIAEYMESLQEENEDAYQKQFAGYITHNISPDDIEEMYENAHKKIRENPDRKPKAEYKGGKPKKYNQTRLTLEERKAKVLAAKQAHLNEKNSA